MKVPVLDFRAWVDAGEAPPTILVSVHDLHPMAGKLERMLFADFYPKLSLIEGGHGCMTFMDVMSNTDRDDVCANIGAEMLVYNKIVEALTLAVLSIVSMADDSKMIQSRSDVERAASEQKPVTEE